MFAGRRVLLLPKDAPEGRAGFDDLEKTLAHGGRTYRSRADELQARLRAAERILALQQEVRQLRGLLPICSYCKNIRDDHDYWHRLEHYISAHSEARFSHGICPDCWRDVVQPELQKRCANPAAASQG